MINTDKINQLATLMPSNSRLPSKTNIHILALSDHSITLLKQNLEVHNHIAFIVIQKEHTHLLTNKLFQSVHCIIVKDVGVILSNNCSPKAEHILEYLVKWSPYMNPKEEIQFYGR